MRLGWHRLGVGWDGGWVRVSLAGCYVLTQRAAGICAATLRLLLHLLQRLTGPLTFFSCLGQPACRRGRAGAG